MPRKSKSPRVKSRKRTFLSSTASTTASSATNRSRSRTRHRRDKSESSQQKRRKKGKNSRSRTPPEAQPEPEPISEAHPPELESIPSGSPSGYMQRQSRHNVKDENNEAEMTFVNCDNKDGQCDRKLYSSTASSRSLYMTDASSDFENCLSIKATSHSSTAITTATSRSSYTTDASSATFRSRSRTRHKRAKSESSQQKRIKKDSRNRTPSEPQPELEPISEANLPELESIPSGSPSRYRHNVQDENNDADMTFVNCDNEDGLCSRKLYSSTASSKSFYMQDASSDSENCFSIKTLSHASTASSSASSSKSYTTCASSATFRSRSRTRHTRDKSESSQQNTKNDPEPDFTDSRNRTSPEPQPEPEPISEANPSELESRPAGSPSGYMQRRSRHKVEDENNDAEIRFVNCDKKDGLCKSKALL